MNLFVKQKRSVSLFLIISFLVHLLLFFLIRDGMIPLASKSIPPQPVWVELKQLTMPREIVDIPKPAVEEMPDNPSAQALYSQKVKEETVNPNPSNSSAAQAPKAAPPKPTLDKDAEKQLALQHKPEKLIPAPMPKPNESIPGMPESGTMFKASQDDYLPNYKVGNRTYINTLANPNVAYYVELKRKFRQTWNPIPGLRNHIQEISRGKIEVVLGISVNRQGEIVDLKLIRSSGINSYDDEGQRAIQDSAPFSSLPSHLLGEDGMHHMAWTFVVYL